MKLHHIGYIVKSINEYEKNLLFETKINDIIDPVQNARLALYSNFGASFIELIEPLNADAFTYAFLEKNGNAYHHLCYEVANEAEMKAITAQQKYLLFKGPLNAVLFEGKVVYFYYTRNKTIVEFLIND
jgi:catechol 2,3-dioxygenase-like lactoylglutathione lyase family enzyme